MRFPLSATSRRRPAAPLAGVSVRADVCERLAGKTLLLCVGAQKAGTSWLHDHLSRHGAVASAGLKEVHFFDRWLQPEATPDVARILRGLEREADPDSPFAAALKRRAAMLADPGDYFAAFAEAADYGARYLLDTTPSYALLSAADWRIVRRLCGMAGVDLKVIFSLRDPVDRLASHEFALRRERGPKHDPRRTIARALDNPGWMARSRYDDTIVALWSALPRAEVRIVFYETLFGEGVAGIEGWLGLPALPPRARRINAATRDAEIPHETESEVAERLAPVYQFVRRWFPEDTPPAWRAPAD